ncbi:Lrp/AsnC family transcriptional regulator [Caulobacter segnis]
MELQGKCRNPNISDLDGTDYQLLRELCVDGRRLDVWLGEQINLSSTAVARRRRSLEERQVVTSYSANLNMPMLGYSVWSSSPSNSSSLRPRGP